MKYIKLFEDNSTDNELDNAKKYPHIFNLFIDSRFLDEKDYEYVNDLLSNEKDKTRTPYIGISLHVWGGKKYLFDVEEDFDTIVEEISKDQYQDFMMKIFKYKPELFTLIGLNKENMTNVVKEKPSFLQTDKLEEMIALASNGLIPMDKLYGKLSYSDKYLHNGELFFKIKDLEELSFMFKDDTFKKCITYFEGDYFVESTYSQLKDMHLDDYTEETIKRIVEKSQEYINQDTEELIDFCEYNSIDISNWQNEINESNLEEFLEIGELEEVRDMLTRAYEEAQESADTSEAYNKAYDTVAYFFGVNNFEFVDEHFLIPFDLKWLMPFCVENNVGGLGVNNNLKTFLHDLFDEWEELPRSLLDEDYERLEVEVPYYGWNGTIDKDVLNEATRERLNWE